MFIVRILYASLLFLILLCTSQVLLGQAIISKLQVNGNTIEMLTNPQADTTFSDDSLHAVTNVIKYHPYPIALNGEKIFGWIKQQTESENEELQKIRYEYNAFLIGKLEEKLKKLPNGYYNLEVDNIVTDKKGNIIYYDLKPFYKDSIINEENVSDKYPLRATKDPDNNGLLSHTVWQLVESALKRRPILIVSGNPVVYWFDVKQRIYILNHELTVAY